MSEPGVQDYEPPAVTVIGSVEELTLEPQGKIGTQLDPKCAITGS